ncbi:MAG TPA: DUF6263 family protein [Candidatus Sulfotelmatobacter sp.]|nr:DUF6263 family protein [Candidatus Sulfotelmatobacter sp.]
MMKTILFSLVLAFFAWAWSGCSKKSGPAAEPPEKQIIGTDATNDSIALKLVWLPGKHYSFRTERVIGTDLTLPGSLGTQTVVIALSLDFSLSVRAPSKDGVQELDLEIAAMKFFFQQNEQYHFFFDSRQSVAEDAVDPSCPLLRYLLNAPFTCFVAEDGTLLRTKGLDAVAAKLKGGNSQLTSILQSVLNEKNLELMYGGLNASLPDAPVKMGDSWHVNSEIDPYGANSLILDGHNTFTNWEMFDGRQCVHAEYQGNFSANAGEPDGSGPIEIQGGTCSSEGWIDPQLGMGIRSSSVAHLKGKFTVMGQTLPAQIDMTSNFRLLSVKDQ